MLIRAKRANTEITEGGEDTEDARPTRGMPKKSQAKVSVSSPSSVISVSTRSQSRSAISVLGRRKRVNTEITEGGEGTEDARPT